MMPLPLAESCRLSGESLRDARVLFEVERCPLPGIYPENPEEALAMTSPLRVVQARQSGFVQLAHVFDGGLYRQYAFAGGGAGAYRRHLDWFAGEIAARFPKNASILEVGCGDGWLLRELRNRGCSDVLGIDPSRAASRESCDWLLSGYFPDDLPADQRNRGRDLVICRHVLEHIESPVPFMKALAEALLPNGELWIEVPDLDCTVERGIWSNFYQLHCNYFSAVSLDRLAATAGLRCIGGSVVEVFGGSLLRRYMLGDTGVLTSSREIEGMLANVSAYQDRLRHLADHLPPGAVGYGAGERTAVTLGLAPRIAGQIIRLHDANPLLSGRYLGGTSLEIGPPESLYDSPPPAIVLFALSNTSEILSSWQKTLPKKTLVAITSKDCPFLPLESIAAYQCSTTHPHE